MDKDEEFLRKSISGHAGVKKFPPDQISKIEDEVVRFWRQGNVRGIDALAHAVKFSKSMGGKRFK